MIVRVKWVLVCGMLIWIPPTVFGKDMEPPPPDSELLEFLGRWEANDGEWIDPFELAEPSIRARQTDSDPSVLRPPRVKGTSPATPEFWHEKHDESRGKDVHE